MAEKIDDISIAVGFDIGTRTTGCVFSFDPDPVRVYSVKFTGGMKERIPTSVLVNDQQQFVAFGFEAEDMYANLDKENKHKGWALFRRFKEQINQLTNLNIHDTEVVDTSQKIRVPAIKLFEMVIGYLKIKTRAFLESNGVCGITDDCIGYVITVPAFWRDSLRCMVRHAADKVGIARDRLQLIQDSDAATIWCHNDRDLTIPELQKPGTKYIVVNMKDPNMVITAHQVRKTGHFKQLTKSVVTEFGGGIVDTQFLIFFIKLFGEETMEEFKTDHPDEYADFIDNFTSIKSIITLKYSEKLKIRIPDTLCIINEAKTKDTGRDFRSVVKSYDRFLKVLGRNRLSIDPTFVRSKIFVHCIENLVNLIGKHPNVKETDYILCTGGFSNCKLVSDVLAAEFPEKKIVCPENGKFSAAKGAVIYRHRPGLLVREAKFTYGRSKYVLFDKELHSGKHNRDIGNENWCTEVFRKYVTKGEEIPYDHEITDYNLLPMEGQRLHATCNMYLSVNESPLFVSDTGCKLVGDPFTSRFPFEKELHNRAYDLTVRFLFDEIRVTFYHRKLGKTQTETFNFL